MIDENSRLGLGLSFSVYGRGVWVVSQKPGLIPNPFTNVLSLCMCLLSGYCSGHGVRASEQ